MSPQQSKPSYRVFYLRFPYDITYARRLYRNAPLTFLSVDKLAQTHVFLCEVPAASLEDVYWQMQSENWSPRGEARPLIEKLNLRHTSMSIGDVVQAPGGRFYVCMPSGWQELRDATESANNGGKTACRSICMD
jgi:hypothetical protein